MEHIIIRKGGNIALVVSKPYVKHPFIFKTKLKTISKHGQSTREALLVIACYMDTYQRNGHVFLRNIKPTHFNNYTYSKL